MNHVDQRLKSPDQIMTEDLRVFSENLTEVYIAFSKPFLDIVLFSKKLS